VTSSPTADCPGAQATTRFQFLSPLPIYPATYIWQAFPRQQAGYYTTFFWATGETEFFWDGGRANSYYGAHPYPQPAPLGTAHKWEIATGFGGDFLSTDDVAYKRWYTQALVAYADAGGKHTIFYYDLPDTSKTVDVTITDADFAITDPPTPALTWGDAPWIVTGNPNAGQGHEIYCGILRGIQVYSTKLLQSEIVSEASSPLSTTAGQSKIWYLNLNPTPSDISDKSGMGHDPAWVGSARPGLWSQ